MNDQLDLSQPSQSSQPSQNTIQFNEKIESFTKVVDQLKLQLEEMRREREKERETWRQEKKQLNQMIEQMSAKQTSDKGLHSKSSTPNHGNTQMPKKLLSSPDSPKEHQRGRSTSHQDKDNIFETTMSESPSVSLPKSMQSTRKEQIHVTQNPTISLPSSGKEDSTDEDKSSKFPSNQRSTRSSSAKASKSLSSPLKEDIKVKSPSDNRRNYNAASTGFGSDADKNAEDQRMPKSSSPNHGSFQDQVDTESISESVGFSRKSKTFQNEDKSSCLSSPHDMRKSEKCPIPNQTGTEAGSGSTRSAASELKDKCKFPPNGGTSPSVSAGTSTKSSNMGKPNENVPSSNCSNLNKSSAKKHTKALNGFLLFFAENSQDIANREGLEDIDEMREVCLDIWKDMDLSQKTKYAKMRIPVPKVAPSSKQPVSRAPIIDSLGFNLMAPTTLEEMKYISSMTEEYLESSYRSKLINGLLRDIHDIISVNKIKISPNSDEILINDESIVKLEQKAFELSDYLIDATLLHDYRAAFGHEFTPLPPDKESLELYNQHWQDPNYQPFYSSPDGM